MRKSPVEQTCRESWIASLMRQLRDEVWVSPLGAADRIRVAEIYGRSVSDVEQQLALDVLDALKAIPLPPEDDGVPDAGSDIIEGRPVSRIDRLLDNIETAQFGEQRHQGRRIDRLGRVRRRDQHATHA